MSGKDTKTILNIAKKLERSQQENIILEQRNKRYCEALLSIANEDTYVATASQIAIVALESESE